MVKNILSIIVGFVVWTIIFLGGAVVIRAARPGVHDESGISSDVLTLVIYLAISFVASLAAGMVAAKISGTHKTICAVVLAICLLTTGILVQSSAWDLLPVWYHLVFLAMLVPVTIVGAALVK